MKTLSALAALMIVAAPAAAHDFWIDLASHRVADGAQVKLRFLIGDLGAIEPWDTQWRKVISLRDYGPAGIRDLQAGIRPLTPTDPGGAVVTLAGAGTHVIAFESALAENDIAADEFNEYAAHEGLTPALKARKAAGLEGTRGRETYSRRAKALVQVGTAPTVNAIKAIGLTLEITPETNPYALKPGQPLVLRVDWHGQPLPGASVVLEPLDGKAAHGTPVITDAQGQARFPAPTPGRWRANVVWTQAITHPRAEFDTVFSSLTFGD
ncbi:MAG: DUF4198 domain-containing protein [Polymorphobacter sp.]